MKYLTITLLLVGAALLGAIVWHTDVAQVVTGLAQVGWVGGGAVILVYLVGFIADTITWYLTLPSARPQWRWAYRLWQAMMVGEALNVVTPLASLGGEPVKAALIRKHLGVGYREGTAAIVLTQTVANLGLVLFLLAGFGLLFVTPSLPESYRLLAGLGLLASMIGMALFVVAQKKRLLSRTVAWMGRGRLSRHLEAGLRILHDVEDRIIEYYEGDPLRFALAMGTAFVNWVLGAVGVFVIMRFLDYPVSFADAWVIESLVMLVRNALFLLPAALGAQEGTFVLVCAALTGSPASGLTVALIVRLRELVWVAWGLAIGWRLEALPARDGTLVGPPPASDADGSHPKTGS